MRKKHKRELRFCQEVIEEMKKPKYQPIGSPFYNPIDPVAINIPHYSGIIKKPMDLGTISFKLEGGQYKTAQEFEGDIRLMFQNCYTFHHPISDAMYGIGKQFEHVFDEKWAEKKQWLLQTKSVAE